jgi:D-alanine-D-alanine ligase
MFVAGCWELLGIPYTGNTPITLGLAQDKVLTKKLLNSEHIPTPDYEVYDEYPDDTHLSYPLIAKPSREDGSVGITQHSVIENRSELQQVVNRLLHKYQQPILVEKFIAGREFNVAVFGNRDLHTLPVSEISFRDVGKSYHAITSYEAKWLEEHPLYHQTPSVCPADIEKELKQNLESTALRVFRILGGRDYGRVDFRMDEQNQIYVLEYNPNPDIAADAGFSKALKAAGIPYENFIEQMLEEALARNTSQMISLAGNN